MEEANNRPFQKREESRRSLFETIETVTGTTYEFAAWNHAKVNIDYHVEFKKNYYSVPYLLVKQEVMVRTTANTVEIFRKNKLIASHVRQNGKKYSYSTLPDHMPESHRQFSEWTPERIKNWSKTVGPNAANLIQALMERKVHPEQAFHACMGIIRLTKSYPKQNVENAAKRALLYGVISYQSLYITRTYVAPVITQWRWIDMLQNQLKERLSQMRLKGLLNAYLKQHSDLVVI